MAVTEAQKRAQKRYNEKNKKRLKVASYRNSAKTFIRTYASDAELDELSDLITERRRINQLLTNLDQIRAFINDEAFLEKHALKVEIWRRPKELLKHRSEQTDDVTAVQSWFDEKIAPRFNKEEPIVEINQQGHSEFYDGNTGVEVLNEFAQK
ncbi:hypothetical protein LROSL1_0090 [Furfurilactobacillus rossiae]|uniref:hypothetical protein n=1 Tax=Furfurilactobacillus rossiae TaxID=231049 RepID=UPI0015C081BE|nr:hypothetical protein [Furfurilactobacillus rossiae]MCF6165076.1 hypothetical protein [Furfurilactobacillus rossiae]QLE62910.1 hypothetical protein LROSL1_0090 [Furfurilactobacillus rossiae]